MFPIWIIAKREFTQNILSLRLFIGLIVCLTLFVASTYVLMEDYEKRLSVHNAAEIEHRKALEAVKVYSHLRVDVAKSPEPLSVICLGMERQLGSTIKVSYEDVPAEAKILGGGNPIFLPRSPKPVWISYSYFYSTLSSLWARFWLSCAMMCEPFELPLQSKPPRTFQKNRSKPCQGVAF